VIFINQNGYLKGVADLNTKENLVNLFSAAENSSEKFWDIYLSALGSMAWNQEQAENLFRKYLEQNKVARDEGAKLMEEFINQARKNQEQMQKMIQESVIKAFSNVDIPTFSYIDDLAKKVDDLNKKINNF
jgi:polyhydroxyalkanoate synthesis regulator phasin